MDNKARKKGTREQLLLAARQELAQGDGDIELASIAKRAGVSDGLTYYHFGNKAGLIKALVDDYHRALEDRVTAIPFEGDSWASREQQRINAMVEFFYSDPVALIIATRLCTEPSLLAGEQARTARLNELGARNIEQAQRSGEIGADCNPLLLVSMLLAGAMEGVRTALGCEPVVPMEEVQQEIWSFIARAAGVPH